MFHSLRWRGVEDLLHTGQFWREEEDLVEGSSRSVAAEEPGEQLQTQSEGHHPEANRLHGP